MLMAAKHLPERGDQGDFSSKASARAGTTTTSAAKHPPEQERRRLRRQSIRQSSNDGKVYVKK
jgi:hypothetical protein